MNDTCIADILIPLSAFGSAPYFNKISTALRLSVGSLKLNLNQMLVKILHPIKKDHVSWYLIFWARFSEFSWQTRTWNQYSAYSGQSRTFGTFSDWFNHLKVSCNAFSSHYLCQRCQYSIVVCWSHFEIKVLNFRSASEGIYTRYHIDGLYYGWNLRRQSALTVKYSWDSRLQIASYT